MLLKHIAALRVKTHQGNVHSTRTQEAKKAQEIHGSNKSSSSLPVFLVNQKRTKVEREKKKHLFEVRDCNQETEIQVATRKSRVCNVQGYMCCPQSNPLYVNGRLWLSYQGLVEPNMQTNDVVWQNELASFKVKNADGLVVMARRILKIRHS